MISHGAQMSSLINWQVAKGRADELRQAERSKMRFRRALRPKRR
jgi:hypothetical protein